MSLDVSAPLRGAAVAAGLAALPLFAALIGGAEVGGTGGIGWLWGLPLAAAAAELAGWPLLARGVAPGLGAILPLVRILFPPGSGAMSEAHFSRLLAATYFAFLLAVVAACLVAVTRHLESGGDLSPRRAAGGLLLYYLVLLPWLAAARPADGDEPYYLLVAHSLAYDGDLDLANNYAARDSLAFMDRALEPQPGDPAGQHGELYSRHAELLPLVLAPGYRAAGRAGALVTLAFLAALLGGELWVLLARRGWGHPPENAAAFAAWAAVMLAPPLLPFATQVWIEVPAALLIVISIRRILEHAGDACANPESGNGGTLAGNGNLVVAATAAAALPFLKERLAAIALPLGLLVLASAPRRWRFRFAAGLAAAAAALTAWNAALVANPFRMHQLRELTLAPLADYARGFAGLFVDTAFGLVPTAPLWIALPAGTVWFFQRQPRQAWRLAAILPLYLLILASRREWYGGWGPPFRYMVPLLPLLALALVPVWERARRDRILAVVLAAGVAATSLLAWLGTIEPGWLVNFADGGTHLVDIASRRMQLDFRRFVPSFTRPNAAAAVALAGWAALNAGLVLRGRRRRGDLADGSPGDPPLGSPLLPPAGLPRLPLAAGALCVLLAALTVLAAARWIPQSRVEWEDPAVAHLGGELSPPRWTNDRTRFRGAWSTRPGDSGRYEWRLPGGGKTARDIVIVARGGDLAPGMLDLTIDGQRRARFAVATGAWQRYRVRGAAGKSEGGLHAVELSVPAGTGVLIDYLEAD